MTAIRWVVSGVLGFTASFLLYELFFASLPDSNVRPTIAWLSSYTLGIAIQHALHRRLVFGNSSSYWRSLRRSYVVYLTGLAIASGLNFLIANNTSLHHRLVWLVTVGIVSVLNYLALKVYAFKEDPAPLT